MGSWGHLTTGIAPNTVSQFLGSHQSPPSTLSPPGGLHPTGVRRVLDSFFLSLLPTKPFWPFPYSMLRLSIRYSPEPLLPRIPSPLPHSTVLTDLWPAFLLGGWGGEIEHRKCTLKSSHILNWVYPVEKILSRRSAERWLGKFGEEVKWRRAG